MSAVSALLDRRAGRFVAALVLPLLGLALWELYARTGVRPSYVLAPSFIAASTWDLAASGELLRHGAASLYRALAGLAIGCACGIALGLLAGVARPVERFYEPIVSFTYPVPKIVVLPILIAWLGSGSASKIAVIAAACFYPSFISALYGAKGIDRLLIWSARNMGAGRGQVFRKVVVPAALPQVLAGLRVALALAFVVVIAAEMSGSRDGLGFLIVTAEDSLRFDLMYAAIVAIGLCGFVFDRGLIALRGRVLAGQSVTKAGGRG
jgi:ABC-type nitrate/sulfonate/bicarbonate transport system permease component